MKKKIINLSFCLSFLFSVVYCFGNNVTDTTGQPVRRLPLLPPSHTIKEAEDKIVTINQNVVTKQEAADALQTKVDKAKTTWENYHAPHANSPTDPGTAATCDSYYQAYSTLSNQLSNLFVEIDQLNQDKKDQEDLIEEKKQEFIDGMIGKSLCASSLSTSSSYDEMMNCWKCFFDGDCRDLPTLPNDPRPPFVVVPNTGGAVVPSTGAPRSYDVLSKEKRKEYNTYNPPPALKSDPPQKGFIEQATEKVRNYFQEIINKSQRIKNRVMAVLAVRG